ncbi:MAG: phage tail protein [Alphaproteobacteria bacterium]|nr:phage tail protein [Alphaproteobacteria bacterium]
MASVVLGAVGAAVGNAILPGIGGALLGTIGAGLGGIVDQQLGLTKHVTGPRLDNLAVQDSRYGAGIPLIYGNARVAGNVIWSTDLMQAQHDTTVGGKGGGGGGVTQTTYTYSVHCAVGICAGPIAGLNTIWADSTVIYQDGVWASGIADGVTIYTGSTGQTSDAFMQSILGTGNVPAYQGLAYIVFDNLQLSNFGNRLPNLTFEIANANVTANPEWLGGTDAAISQRASAVQSGTMLPLVLEGNGSDAQLVLVGGYTTSGSTLLFTVAEYDVTEDTPLSLLRVSSAAFTASSPVDCSWAWAPDGRFIAMYLQTSSSPNHHFVLYDTATQSFGAVYNVALAASSSIKQVAWVDAQHFVIDDSSGTVRGLHVFARSGTGIIDLGFTGLWGSGSTTSTALFYGAQFTPHADGLIAYSWITAIAHVLNLQARRVVWRNNALSLGPVYTVSSSLAIGTGSGPHARFIQSANGEWILFYGTVVDYRLMSFEPSASSATITRAWQTVTLDFGTGTTNFPVFYGNRLLIAQRAASESTYRLSEVAIGASSFSLTVDGAVVVNGGGLESDFGAMRIDESRILLMGMGGFSSDIGQLGIIERNVDGSVAAILADILARAGYAPGDYDVSALDDVLIQGYVLQEPMSARNAIEPLQIYTTFDLIESAGELKAVPRGGAPAATIGAAEWRAAADGKAPPPPLAITRAQEMDLPREVDVDAIDPARNFEVNSQRARRLASSARSVQKLTLPVVCDAATAKQIAETRLFTAWAERELVKLSVSRAWLAVDPADVIDLGNGNQLRVASVNQSGGLMQVEGFYSYAPGLTSAAAADGGQSTAANANAPVPSVLYLMDLPLLQSADDQPGVYAAVTGLPGWMGAVVMRSSDGVNYNAIGSAVIAAAAGIAATVLANGSALYMDNVGSVSVQLTQGSLASVSWIDLSNGANAAFLGGEIIQFQTATLTGPGQYLLSGLLRGRRGTESATGSHAVGEAFVLLQSGAVNFLPDILSDRNVPYDFRALTTGQSLGDAADYPFTYGMKTLCPFAPVNVAGVRASGTGSDLTVTWVRRARLNAEWANYIDVPLDEPQEIYELDVMNGSAVVRAFTGLTSPTVTYTAAQQTADWGTVPAHFTVNIYQVSSRYGNGNAATAVI